MNGVRDGRDDTYYNAGTTDMGAVLFGHAFKSTFICVVGFDTGYFDYCGVFRMKERLRRRMVSVGFECLVRETGRGTVIFDYTNKYHSPFSIPVVR